jgi:hypothetical protein
MAKFELPYDTGKVDRTEGADFIPSGVYLMEIDRCVYQEGKNGKSDQLLVAMKVVDAEEEKQKKYKGSTIIDYVSFHANADWRMSQFLDAVYGRRVDGAQFDTDEMVGKRLVAKTMEDEYEGKDRSRVERFSPVSKWRGDEPKADKVSSDDEVDL